MGRRRDAWGSVDLRIEQEKVVSVEEKEEETVVMVKPSRDMQVSEG